ncbi:MAG: DUF835 domain-containing protein [Candidatus Thermoplasmatota archaeon]|nr:DUF835 domain-containing protein [Candidatus Thermoplasmatota archaeon]
MDRVEDGNNSFVEEDQSEGAGHTDAEDDIRVRTRLRPLMDDKDGTVVLGRSESAHRRWRRKATLDIGKVGEHQDEGVDLFSRRVLIDAAFPHIIFICGKRGSGKSYTLGLFAEELARSCIGVGVVLVDPIGIFWSLKKENENTREIKKLKEWGLSPHSFPEVRVLVPGKPESLALGAADGPFTIGVGEMTAEDWCQIFDMDRFKTQGLLIGAAIDMVRSGYKAIRDGRIVSISGKADRYSLGDLVNCIRSSVTLTSKEGGFTPQTRRSLIARFNAAGSWGIFSIDGTPLNDVTSPNRVTVVDISDPNLGDDKRSLITGVIARKILSARIYSARQEDHEGYDESEPDHIPVTWLMIDEAHVILPHNRQTPATEALVEYAKQGRRPGCALVLATQRPASTSDEILSQVDILIGHNLALEDDMSALRRRVPAKLPPEFANSDFIRAIPVGTAIVADQRTQQRAFLMGLRPRMSHHAGSSAMPSALSDRSQKKVSMPMSATRSNFEDPSAIMRPTDGFLIEDPSAEEGVDLDRVYGDPKQPINVQEMTEGVSKTNHLHAVQDGNTILIITGDPGQIVLMSRDKWTERGFVLISRIHPSRYPNIDRVRPERTFWLSSTPSEISSPPNDIQDLLMDLGRILETKERRILVFDGLETLFVENEHRSVIRFLQALREKVFLGGHVMLVRADSSLPSLIRENISREMDAVIELSSNEEEQEDTSSSKQEDKVPITEKGLEGGTIIGHGSLSAEELREMCRIMGLSDKGDEKEMLDRIIDSGEREGLISGKEKSADISKMISDLSRISRENIELREKVSVMERKVKGASTKKKVSPSKNGSKRKRLQVVWEDDDKTSLNDMRSAINSLSDELSKLKMELKKKEVEARLSKDTVQGKEEVIEGYMKALEQQRSQSMERISELEDLLKQAMTRLDTGPDKKVAQSLGSKHPITKTQDKVSITKALNSTSDIAEKSRKLKVVKQKDRCVIISGRVSPEKAALSVKKTLKRTLLRGPLERIVEIWPAYIPLFRCLVTYRTGFMMKLRTGDVFIDPLTSQEVRSSSSGMRRSKGTTQLMALTPMERRCFNAFGRALIDETKIMGRSGLNRSQVKRALNSMEKKGVIEKRTLEDSISSYRISKGLSIDPEPWKRSSDWIMETTDCIGEKVLSSGMDEKAARALFGIIWPGAKITEVDIVHYPIYIAKIEGEGRLRYCIVDAVSGTVDEDLTTRSRNII